MKLLPRKIALPLLVFAVVIISLNVIGQMLVGEGKRHVSRCYDQLRLGMSKSDALALFGYRPDFECRFRQSDIWFYCAHGFASGEIPANLPKQGMTYDDLAAVPDVYDHVQLVFDHSGKLTAYTWIGESYTVHTTGGEVDGSHVKRLPPDFFD